MFSIFQPDLINTTPQVFPLVGGQSGSISVYLQFAVAPSAGTVTVEYRRPSSAAWIVFQGGQSASVVPGSLTLKIDGGVSAPRITFTELVGGAGLLLATSEANTAAPPNVAASVPVVVCALIRGRQGSLLGACSALTPNKLFRLQGRPYNSAPPVRLISSCGLSAWV